jgi:Kelch motif
VLTGTLALGGCGQTAPVVPSPTTATHTPDATDATSTSGLASPAPSASASARVNVGAAFRVRVAIAPFRLPSPVSRSVGLVFGDTILVCGGLTSVGATTGSIERIDLAAGRITSVGRLGSPVHDAGGVVIDKRGLIIGGGRFGPGATVQRIGPGGTSADVGHLPSPRADLAAVAVGTEFVVVGGGTPARPDTRVLATTDGMAFTTVARLRIGVRYPAVAVLDGIIYVIGGSAPSGDVRDIQAIDPATGVVRVIGHLERGLSHGTALVIAGRILLAGGRFRGRAQDGLWRLDPAHGTVARIGRLPYAVSDAAGAVVGDAGYLIGGEGTAPLASVITVSAR